MIYTALTKQAMKLAYRVHHGQTDKSGIPYIFHPMHLAEQMEDEFSTCAALLHDVVEDTELTFADLEAEGFPPEVTEALKLLTHDPAVPYLEYVKAIRPNPIARAVKLADLRHNSDLTRMDTVDERALRRKEKYQNAIRLLTEE